MLLEQVVTETISSSYAICSFSRVLLVICVFIADYSCEIGRSLSKLKYALCSVVVLMVRFTEDHRIKPP